MREYPIDFIGIDYAIDNRIAEEEILPLARDEGIAVVVYLPFGRSRMWQRIGDLDALRAEARQPRGCAGSAARPGAPRPDDRVRADAPAGVSLRVGRTWRSATVG